MYRRSYYYRDPYTSDRYNRRSYDDGDIRPSTRYSGRYSDSEFPSLLYYGRSRPSNYEYPWMRDYGLRRRREERETRDESREEHNDEPEIRDPDKDKEVNKEFHVLKIDLNMKRNCKEHHTDKYICTRRKDNPEIVVRRGQGFVMTIDFDREYSKEKNELTFSFKIGKDARPSKRTAARFTMNENANSKGDLKEWFARLVKKGDKSIEVEIVPPCNCIPGEWRFSLQTESKLKSDDKPLLLEYKHNEDINIVLNPWCQDDPVYLSTEQLLDEYILNESGAIWSGNYKQKGIKPWNFGQFQDGILRLCFHLIRKVYNNTVDPAMADPVKLSRAISKIVNAPDDSGVLVGNWSGDYSDGTPPMKWVGSVAILKEYEKNKGNPVKFGQCWVFSAVTTTVCRALGLPARSVTNFASAHDTDGTTCIDKFFERKGNSEKLEEIHYSDSSDSVWNFHVWNEVWMSRPDLGKGYDGWQVIDATPQEISEGVYQCGPAPVSAIKKGEIGTVNYDAPFIFAEVNADKVHWERLKNGDFVVIKTDTNDVGRDISTKIPNGKPYNGEASIWRGYGEKYRLDITSEYKYQEGTLEERLAVQNANKAARVDRDVMAPSKKMDISVEIIDKDGVMVGNDFEVEVLVKNTRLRRDDGLRTVKCLQVNVDSLKYTGDGRRSIVQKTFDDIRLDYSEEKTVKFTVKTDEYWDKMYDLFGMEITVFAYVKETENHYLKTDEYRLRRPDITVDAPKTVKVGKAFDLKLSFKNTLHKPLTECSLLVEGNGIDDRTVKLDDVSARSEWTSTQSVTAENSGEIQINVSFDCKELKDIIGLTNVEADD